ncbi:acyl-CoA dehydrogenase [Tistrella mobilis]|uniref:acyl-CoA dehydrogenase n=1 Tax=Tistrella mobilis TaxID=171437 RepID=UPI0031F6CE68
MFGYTAPIRDMRFVMREIVDIEGLSQLPGCDAATPDTVDAILEEAGKLAGGVIAPLNRTGDQTGSRVENGVVRTPEGWREAYRQFVDGGWNSIPFEPEFGGQGLPITVASACAEMWNSANMAWGLCPLLTIGAVEALTAHGSDAQKQTYLEKLVSGEWTGTMCLTEPQAGSDLALLRSKAVKQDDGTYAITGTKIFITYGEHDLTENIVHLVLARTPDAPAGVKGISLFIVPKFLVNADGTLGQRNDLRCASLEHKLGIHGSPTAVMQFGDGGGATGYLIGEENRGLQYMFTMMNNARLNVGIQGYAIAERAYQQALAYAQERRQGRAAGAEGAAPLIMHPDVRRNLMLMKSQTEAARALGLYTAAMIDRARHTEDAEARRQAQRRVEVMIPIVKGWSTDLGFELASTGVQIHGGMGYVEETGAAQHLRDARICLIYEGTNGIQAMDLVGRKLSMDNGQSIKALVAEMGAAADALKAVEGDDAATIAAALAEAVAAADDATDWLIARAGSDAQAVLSGATAYARLMGTVAGGWMMAISAAAAIRGLSEGADDAAFLEAKLITARFYAEQVLPLAAGLARTVKAGSASIMALSPEQFAA